MTSLKSRDIVKECSFLISKGIAMASQRDYESVVWHYMGDQLKTSTSSRIEDWFYSYAPQTDTQKERWENAIAKVQSQIEKFQGEDNLCGEFCPELGDEVGS